MCPGGQPVLCRGSAAWPAGGSWGYPCGGPGEPCPGLLSAPATMSRAASQPRSSPTPAGYSDAGAEPEQTFEDVPPGSTFSLCGAAGGPGRIGAIPAAGRSSRASPPANRPYFRPNNNVTRGQLAKIVSGAAGWTETPDRPDVRGCAAGQHLLSVYRAHCRRGIVSGYPCGGLGEPCVPPPTAPTSAPPPPPRAARWQRSPPTPSSPPARRRTRK